MRRSLVVLLTLVVAVLGLTTAASAGATGTISGKVTDSGGTPLSGVKVEARSWFSGSVGQATTGGDGTFTVSGLPADDYVVCFNPADATGGLSPTGYRDTCWEGVDSTEGIGGDQITFVAVPDGGGVSGIVQALPSTGGVSGTVTDGNGTPLAGAVVTASSGPGSPEARGRATTDGSGHYAITRLRPGTGYTVCVAGDDVSGGLSAVGYLDNCLGNVQAQSGYHPYPSEYPTFEVAAATSNALDPIELGPAARIEGTLTDKVGQPIPGVRIQGDRRDDGPTVNAVAVTDSNGHYVLGINGDEGGWANGLFSGTRLPSAPYEIYYNTHDVPTYVSQRYEGVLTAYGKSFGGTATIVTPAAGVVTTVDDQLTLSASIAGAVTDSHGTGIAGVSVSLSEGGDYLTNTTSDESGHYDFGTLPAGSYELCYEASTATGGSSAAGYMDSCGPAVSIATGQQRAGVNRVLQAASGISGTLFGSSFEPLQYRTVRLYEDGSPGWRQASTNSEGKYLFGRLPAGTYKVCFQVYSPVAWEGCYDGAADVASATPIATTLGKVVTGINAQAVAVPDTTAPTATMTKPSTLLQTGRTVSPAVATADSESGVASYDLRYRYADWNDPSFSEFVSPASWQTLSGPAPTFTGAPGRTYCFSVRAHDNVGNSSGYSAERCVVVPLDDRALKPTSGRWSRVGSPRAFGDTVTRTSTYGATLTRVAAHADRVGLIVTACPTCGRVGVFLNGTRLATFNTWSSTVRKKVLFLPRTFGYRRATISLKLVQRNRSLIVDALAVTRK